MFEELEHIIADDCVAYNHLMRILNNPVQLIVDVLDDVVELFIVCISGSCQSRLYTQYSSVSQRCLCLQVCVLS